jgi:hypothetical protein
MRAETLVGLPIIGAYRHILVKLPIIMFYGSMFSDSPIITFGQAAIAKLKIERLANFHA